MAMTKVNSAIAALVNDTQQNTATQLGKYIVDKLGEEYDDEFVEAVTKLIEEFKTAELKELKVKTKGRGKGSLSDDGTPKKKRAPTEYNKFIAAKMAEIKASDPSIKGKDLMTAATIEWQALKNAPKANTPTAVKVEIEDTEDEAEA